MGEIGLAGMIILSVFVTLLSAIYVMLWEKGRKFDYMISGLTYRKDPLKDTYLFGLALLELIHYRYTSIYDRKMEKHFRVLCGSSFAEYYRRINMTQKLSVSIPVLIFFCILAAAANDRIFVFLAFGGAAGIAYYFDAAVFEAIAKHRAAIRRELPEVLLKLTLLVNAGMVLRDAWRKTALSGDGILYSEMRKASEQSDNGVSEYDAYVDFAARCGEQSVEKAVSAIVQNLSKGNRELAVFLQSLSKDSWNERKQSVRRKGEEASAKMLIPIGLMFLGILLMVMLPIMGNLTY